MMVSASILSANFANLEGQLKKVEEAGIKMVHIDVMDGVFVPNLTIGDQVIRDIRKKSNLIFDTHLMIKDPSNYIEKFANAGSDIITIHIESEGDARQNLMKIKSFGKKCGISLKPNTNANAIKSLIDIIDYVLIMTVEPGFGGQVFMQSQLEKITEISKIISESKRDILISVDGGINDKTAPLAINAGANILVSGSYLFSHLVENYQKLINI